MKKKGIRSLFSIAALCLSSFAIGRSRVPQFVFPQINTDNTVVFRFFTPSAKDIKPNVQFERGVNTLIHRITF